MSLQAPQALLVHLLGNIDEELVAACSDMGETLAKRNKLAARDEATIAEGVAAITKGQRGRKWFVLEGESKPDVLLETEDLVLCIEGKRTEATCTTKTQWMRQRAQLVRHMDAAMDLFPRKRVLGLLLVEGSGGAEAVLPSSHWKAESEAAYSPAMTAASLPHRDAGEHAQVAANILGVATWQAACRALDIDWHSLPDWV